MAMQDHERSATQGGWQLLAYDADVCVHGCSTSDQSVVDTVSNINAYGTIEAGCTSSPQGD
jgi:hypothetical protein